MRNSIEPKEKHMPKTILYFAKNLGQKHGQKPQR